MADSRFALRTIARMPGAAAVIVVSLAIGIGVNTAIFSWIESRVLRPFPAIPGSGRLQLVEPRAQTGSYPGVSWREFLDLRPQLTSFRDLVASRMVTLSVGEPGRVERAIGALVSGNFFAALGLRPALGRFPTDADIIAAPESPIVVVSHRFWQTRLEGSTTAVGRSVRVNGQPLTVVGVAPADFQGTVSSLVFDLWVPATLAPLVFDGSRELDDRRIRGYSAMGFPAAGVTAAQAQQQVDAAMRQLAVDYPATNASMRAEVMPIYQAPRGPQRFMTTALGVLQTLMLLLLLAVCGNAATLMLARAHTRQREMGLRLALGAGRARIVRLLLIESLMLATIASVLGAAMAVWASAAIRDVPLPGSFPIEFRTTVGVWSVSFAAALGLGCGLAFGLLPALQLSRVHPNTATRTGSFAPARRRTRSVLIAAQIALAMIVLAAAASFLDSFGKTRTLQTGFDRHGVLLAAYDLSPRRLPPPASLDFARRLLDRLRETRSVAAAAIGSSVPLDLHGMPMRAFTLEGRGRPGPEPDQTLFNTVTPGYFTVMRIPIVAGADFVGLDDRTTGKQAIVNQAFIRTFVGTGEPLGRRIDTGGATYVIVGVVATTVYDAFGEPPAPMLYVSYRDRPSWAGEIHVRARGGDEHRLAGDIRQVVRELDPELPVYNVRSMNEHVEQNLVFTRIPARLFAVLGPLLLVLAAIGVYAVVACAVSQRTSEIGVRLALGATTHRIIRQLVGETLLVVAFGGAAGWILAWVIQVDVAGAPANVSAFAGVPLLLLLVAAVAAWWPARRVTAVDPVVALRHE